MLKHKKEKNYKLPTVTKRQRKKRKLIEYILFILPIIILYIVMMKILLVGIVPTSSMYPLMNNDSGIIGNRLAYIRSTPQRGDVVVFKKANVYMVKRIIGIPGDDISIQNGLIYINEQPVVEEYLGEDIKTEPINGINYFQVPGNSYFVLGDNRNNSNDSRAWRKPFIKEVDVTAKVSYVFSLNPFSNGMYFKDVGGLLMEEIKTDAPAFDKNNIITEAIHEKEDKSKYTEVNKSEESPTLPVKEFVPETIMESNESALEDTSGNQNEYNPSGDDNQENAYNPSAEEGDEYNPISKGQR